MERPNTVAGLVAKREAMRRDLAEAEAVAKAIRINLDHLDATLRLFTEDAPRRLPAKPQTAHRARRGELQRFVLAALRGAPGPLTSKAITEAWTEARGLSADHETFVLLRKRTGACLTKLRAAGVVEKTAGEGEYAGWRLA